MLRWHDRPRMNFTTLFRAIAGGALVVHLLAPTSAFAQVNAGKAALVKLAEVERFLNGLCAKTTDRKDMVCVSRETVFETLRGAGWCFSTNVQGSRPRAWAKCAIASVPDAGTGEEAGARSAEQQACTLLTFTASSAAVWRDSGVPFERVRAYVGKLLSPMPTWSRRDSQWWEAEVSRIYFGRTTPQDAQRLFEAQCEAPARSR
jgi:hypothetical protein